MKRRQYINDPQTRYFFERFDSLKWWESLIYGLLGAIFMFVFLIARIFGWKPTNDE